MPAPRTQMIITDSPTSHIFNTYYPSSASSVGSLDACIAYDDPDNLKIESIYVDENFRRRGIGSYLLKSTVRGVLALHPQIASCSSVIREPGVIAMRHKIFGKRVNFYESITETGLLHQITTDEASVIVAEHQRLFASYTELGLDIPRNLDRTITSHAEIDEDMVRGWPLPAILRVSH